eukprot:31029-Pelagococcus_subviridis.AAC.12
MTFPEPRPPPDLDPPPELAVFVGALSSRTVRLRSPRVWPGGRGRKKGGGFVGVRSGRIDRARAIGARRDRSFDRSIDESALSRANWRRADRVRVRARARTPRRRAHANSRERIRKGEARRARTLELRDRGLRLRGGGVLHDAVPARAPLAALGNVHVRDGAARGEDRAELVHVRGPREVADVEAVGGDLVFHVRWRVWRVRVRATARCVIARTRRDRVSVDVSERLVRIFFRSVCDPSGR